jgi:hypothetical protein
MPGNPLTSATSGRSLAVDSETQGWRELQVANPSFLLSKLGAECTDTQQIRELTMNGIQAIHALGPSTGGRVVWDLDWRRFDASAGRVRKLCVIDTGVGMGPEELLRYINHLAASSHRQGRTENFGIGAKIAAGTRNSHGLEYRTWKDGRGALVVFGQGPTAPGGCNHRPGRTVGSTTGGPSMRTRSRGP